MKRVARIALKFTAFIMLLLCVLAAWFYLGVWVPHKTISDSAQWNPDYGFKGEMPRKKIRDACHKILWNWVVGGHDAFLALEKVGNKDSIRCLIWALRWQNVMHRKDIANEEMIECTYGHCICALEKLTGMSFGGDYKAWKNWWKQTGRHLPFDEEKGRLVLPGGGGL